MRRFFLSSVLALLGCVIPARANIDFTQFHTPAQLDNELTNLVTAHPDIAQNFSIGMSVNNTPIRGIKISSNPALDDPSKQDVIFVGLHHAREWISAEMALFLAEYLVTHYQTDADLQACLNNLQVWIIPVLNPDGYAYTASVYRYWRKNRRNNGDGTFGVDLNRNYSYEWGLDSGSSGFTNDDTYRGPSAFSEPETTAFRDFVQARHNARAVLSYHSFSELFLRPWSYTTSDPPGKTTLQFVQQNSISRIAAVHGHTYGETIWYTSSGEATDYFWGQARIGAFTTELRPSPANSGCGLCLAGFSPSPTEIIPNNEENLPAALALIHDVGCRKVWIKDHPADSGVEPSAIWLGDHWSNPFWTSPDIWSAPDPPIAGQTATLNVRVHNDSTATLTNTIVRAYYTDPRVALEFPSLTSVLIGEQTVSLPPGDTTLTFNWAVPSGTNIWGEHHWCVGAIVTNADDRPLTTQIQLSNNIGAHNFQTVEFSGARTLFVAVTNFLDVAAEYDVVIDPKSLSRAWEVRIPRIPPRPKPNRKALLLGVKGGVLEPGETIVQPILVRIPGDAAPGTEAEIHLNGVLNPLVPGKRRPVGNGFTFQVRVPKYKSGPESN